MYWVVLMRLLYTKSSQQLLHPSHTCTTCSSNAVTLHSNLYHLGRHVRMLPILDDLNETTVVGAAFNTTTDVTFAFAFLLDTGRSLVPQQH